MENSTFNNETLLKKFEEFSNCSSESDYMKIYEDMGLKTLQWWLDYIGILFIGIIGFLGNSLVIPILLSSEKLDSTFNKLLIWLSVYDNLFIFTIVSEAFRKYVTQDFLFHKHAFAYFLYQLQSISLLCSIYTTVVLAIERYLATSKPIEYHMAIVSSTSTKRGLQYMVPTTIFSVLFNIPKFWELEVKVANTNINDTIYDVDATDLRRNPNYSFFYVHLLQFFVKGIIPFGALLFLNLGIYRAIKNRKANTSNNSSEHENEDRRCAIVLFGIVMIFLVSNIPRIVLNAYEFFVLSSECIIVPFWVYVMTSINGLCLTFNSSFNFFVYCFVNPSFRGLLNHYYLRLKDFCFKLCCTKQTMQEGNNVKTSEDMVELEPMTDKPQFV